MKNKKEIERKFLVREAQLREAENVRLVETTSTYLDPYELNKYEVPGFPKIDEEVLDKTEMRVSKKDKADTTVYEFIVKIGGPALSRDESIVEIDEELYDKIVTKFGQHTISKKRFKFDYLRKKWELDVFPDLRLIVMEIELEKEDEMVALPPFVTVVREVTGDPEYYNVNMAKRLTESVTVD